MKKIFLIILFLSFSKVIYAEPITWKFDNPTIEKCQKESFQSLEVCTKIMDLIKESEQTGEIAVGTVIEKDVTWIDLTKCTIGNEDKVCQGKENPLSVEYQRPFIGTEIKQVKGYVKIITDELDQLKNGLIISSKNVILVPDARYIGKGKYCYPKENQWECDK